MEAKETFFGVEIETLCPSSLEMMVGGYHHGIQVPWLPAGWTASCDGSISTNQMGWRGVEIVSPKLKGDEGIREVISVCQKLREKGFRTNRTCGVHVSVDWGRHTDSETLSRLITISSYLEDALYASTGTVRRRNVQWCKSIKKYGGVKRAKNELDVFYHTARYHLLNLTNLHNNQDRVEFRVFSGSLDEMKIVAWIQVCLGIVERAKNTKRSPKWNGSLSPRRLQKEGGRGQAEMERLLTYLAWNPYRAKKVHGGKMFGWISDAIPQAKIRSVLRNLAKKYDETQV